MNEIINKMNISMLLIIPYLYVTTSHAQDNDWQTDERPLSELKLSDVPIDPFNEIYKEWLTPAEITKLWTAYIASSKDSTISKPKSFDNIYKEWLTPEEITKLWTAYTGTGINSTISEPKYIASQINRKFLNIDFTISKPKSIASQRNHTFLNSVRDLPSEAPKASENDSYLTRVKLPHGTIELPDTTLDGLLSIITKYPNIKSLSLRNCGKLTCAGIRRIAKMLPSLMYVNLSESNAVINYKVNKVIKFNEVNKVNAVNDVVIVALAEKCRGVTHLKLSGLTITEEVIMALIEERSLTQLKLSHYGRGLSRDTFLPATFKKRVKERHPGLAISSEELLQTNPLAAPFLLTRIHGFPV